MGPRYSFPLRVVVGIGLLTIALICQGCSNSEVAEAPVPAEEASAATFTNPLNDSGPDPWMTWYEGYYYLAATTWGDASVGLTLRKAPTIAASACWGPDYKLGLLEYKGGDPLDAESWYKYPEPVFQRADDRSVFAPGHNTFFKSPDGTEDWMAYHANDQESDGCDMGRSPRIQRFTWNEDGTPNFGIPASESMELAVPSREAEE